MADHGVEALPDVPLDFPDWLTDLRAEWAGSDDSDGSPA
jgi:hypothetical protein